MASLLSTGALLGILYDGAQHGAGDVGEQSNQHHLLIPIDFHAHLLYILVTCLPTHTLAETVI